MAGEARKASRPSPLYEGDSTVQLRQKLLAASGLALWIGVANHAAAQSAPG